MTNGMTKQTKVSIGLVIVAGVFIVGGAIAFTEVRSAVSDHIDSPRTHDFVPEGELNQRLKNIEDDVALLVKTLIK